MAGGTSQTVTVEPKTTFRIFCCRGAQGWLRKQNRDMHKGIDIKAPMRSHVIATADGVVVFAGVQRGYGNVVKIEHGGGFQTVYGHLDSYVVKQGEQVRAGTILGRLGRTGNASTQHVHYEVVKNGTPINPSPFLPATDQLASN